MSTDRPAGSKQLPSSALQDASGSLLPGGKLRAGMENGAHWLLLPKAPAIVWSHCGVKRPGHDCKHSFGLVTGFPKTACPAISRHLIDSGKATADQGVRWGRAVGAYSDGAAGGDHHSGFGYWLTPVRLWLPPQTIPPPATRV